MPAPVKTQAVVLRSIRYGEADRIVHLYTPGRGRVGAIAKGVRRSRSRFGGRLEPFFRLDLVLHEGRGETLTVTSEAGGGGGASPRSRRRRGWRAPPACAPTPARPPPPPAPATRSAACSRRPSRTPRS